MTETTTTVLDLTGYSIDPRFPYPQVFSIAKLAMVVDLVDSGADTDEAIAVGLGVVDRQGAMYGTAGGYLGLLAETDAAPRTWGLTAAGARFLAADPATRVLVLAHLFDLVATEGTLTTVDGMDLSEVTAATRLSGIASCQAQLEDAGATAQVMLETDATRDRVPAAAAHAIAQRAARATVTVVRTGATCGSCFTVMPVTGVCDWCD